ncbi:MAG TPA: undecaprenyl-diphosphate phosphatase [Holophaga sp.]|jgi:undecaprenyl-diphosphatase|nr:undecaprenyl-diphosphate phosphatase [Holophaga sp.]
MHVWHAILLGLIQGLTEFLPVSSTAHLTFAENLLLKRSMPLAFDVLLHVGTLVALVIYFRRELIKVLKGLLGQDPEGRRLALWLFIAMIPTGVFAILLKHFKESQKDHLWLYGVFLLITAAMLWIANTVAKRRKGRAIEQMGAVDALCIGAIQGLGGGSGLSRSGSTLSMGVFCGMDLAESTRFSFLLGIPTITAAALMEGRHLMKALVKGTPIPIADAFPAGSASPALLCLVGVVVSGLAGYAAIGLLNRFTRSPRLQGFAGYCLVIGIFVLVYGLR